MKITKILGLVLLLLSVALLIAGLYQFNEFRQSFGGKAASLGNQISRAAGGSSSIAKGYAQPIILMAAGAVAGGVGFVLFRKR